MAHLCHTISILAGLFLADNFTLFTQFFLNCAYQLNIFALELEADLWHGEAVEVPRQLGTRVLDGKLGDLVLLEEVGPVGVSLVRLLVNVEALGELAGHGQVEWFSGRQVEVLAELIVGKVGPVSDDVGRRVGDTEPVLDCHTEHVVPERSHSVDFAADATNLQGNQKDMDIYNCTFTIT